jgi:hypothetical protein
MNHPTFQGLMDEAYATWQADNSKSYDDFIFDLPPIQRMAVLIGNLNYQVENGGFRQWIGNGYSDHAKDVRRVLDRIGTPAAYTAANLVLIGARADEDDDLDAQDAAYYKLNDQLMADAEAFFVSLTEPTSNPDYAPTPEYSF